MKCGIIFAKYRPGAVSRRPRPRSFTESAYAAGRRWLIESDTTTDSVTLYGRAILWLVLVGWGLRFILTPLETNYTGESFLHLVNLPFHEAGHMLFMPFGRFMMILGGSLGQILMPLICLIALLMQSRDPFGASVALWWTGESIMDVAPYINDARALDLLLLGGVTGKETDGHDWNNLLGMLGWLEYDHRLAHLAYNAGSFLMLLSVVWGATLLRRHWSRKQRTTQFT
ncbi:MAG: zinc ribbon domain-containing protein [Nitrospiraceae bacterium]|nr:zinc ribbon domain-containing protein [Nitrospiraceae bacterium]